MPKDLSKEERFEQATEKWTRKKRLNRFSQPSGPGLGAVAILVSSVAAARLHGAEAAREINSFLREGAELASQYDIRGYTVDLRPNATRRDLAEVLGNAATSDIITIGNGTLASYVLEATPQIRHSVDWWDVSRAATHLKQGKWIHRACGFANESFAVGFGIFALSDHRNFSTALGSRDFNPRSLRDPVNNQIVQVYNTEQVTADDVLRVAAAAR
jgi:hypothetical protein